MRPLSLSTLFGFWLTIISLGVLASPAKAADMTAAEKEAMATCMRLNMDYSYYRDHGDAKSYAALFTENGVQQLASSVLKGRKAIEEEAAARMKGTVSRHVLTNIRINLLDSTHADGVAYISFYIGKGSIDNGRPLEMDGPYLVGEYHDTYVKTKDGWRFASRKLVPVFASARAFEAETARANAAKAGEKTQ